MNGEFSRSYQEFGDNRSRYPALCARQKVLMSAFACEPDEGSEPEVGWRWALVMAKCCDVTVVTQTKNRLRIEAWLQLHGNECPAPRFEYLELGPKWRWIKKHFPGGMYIYYTLWQWKLNELVAELLGKVEFDLIHHVTFASFRMPVFASGRPVVWGPVGGAETAAMALLAGHGTFLGRLRERVRNLSTRMAGHLVHLWEPSLRSGGAALASTPATAEVLSNAGIPCRQMPTIGFDSGSLAGMRPVSASGTPLRLLFVGRLHLLKGVHLLLRALALPGSAETRLTIVGDGPERFRLEELARELEVQERVEFAGFVPRSGLGAIYARHDVMVAPSAYESGGLSVLEGFSHGLPAIVLDCGGHALSVADGCGFRISPVDPADQVIRNISRAIHAYMKDRSLVATHGTAARNHLKEQYSWVSKREAMMTIYTAVQDRTNHKAR
jgi:glycosyltransferase involved in cell wall biosynthesis